MSINVLVADDSATIQKVVSITLANESVNLISCESEGDLLAKIGEGNVQAVLLDFGLSQDKTGFDLISSILSINSNIKILTMLPAFEQVDENKLSEAGSFGSIAKPFESSKFIGVFRDMIASIDYEDSSSDTEDWIASSTEDSKIGEAEEVVEETENFDPDQWVSNTSFTDHSQVTEASPIEAALEEEPVMEEQFSEAEKNELSATISDWGIDIPSPIEQQNASGPSFPPIINEMVNVSDPGVSNEFSNDDPFMQAEDPSFDESSAVDEIDEWSMPNQQFEDLSSEPVEAVEPIQEIEPIIEETPIETIDSPIEMDPEPVIESNDSISFDSETSDDEDEEESTIYPEGEDLDYPDMDLTSSTPSNDLTDLEKEDIINDDPIIFDDPAAVPASKRRPHVGSFDNLELASATNHSEPSFEKRDTLGLEEEVESDIDPSSFWDEDSSSAAAASSAHANPETTTQPQMANIDVEKFFNEIKLELLDRVDRIVREVCEEKIEKVAWEVIPEIAENLIKKEIKSIQQDEEFR